MADKAADVMVESWTAAAAGVEAASGLVLQTSSSDVTLYTANTRNTRHKAKHDCSPPGHPPRCLL